MAWDNIQDFVVGVDTFSAEDFNERLEVIRDRTDILQQQIVNDFIRNGIGFPDNALQGCKKGRFVSYDPTTQMYKHAKVGDTTIVGLLTTDPVVGTDEHGKAFGHGTILTSGAVRNADIIKEVTGLTDPPTGAYYLADNGRITKNISDYRAAVYCGTLTSNGCLVIDIHLPSELIGEDGTIVNPGNVPNIVADTNSIIEVNTVGNTIEIGTVEKLTDPVVNGLAVAKFDSSGYATCPVVNKVKAGAGIVVNGTDGTFTISTKNLNVDEYLDMNIINSTGVIFGTLESDLSRIKFPANSTSQIVGTLRIPNIADNYNAQIFAHLDNDSSELTAKIQVLSPGDDNKTTENYSFIDKSGSVLYSKVFSVTANSLVTLLITAKNPSQMISLVSCGLKVTPA